MIFQSLLEDDFYKFTMLQAMLHNTRVHSQIARYEFVCRNTPEFPLTELLTSINDELDNLCSLRFTTEELDYLKSIHGFTPDYISFLKLFQFDRSHIRAYENATDGSISIIAEGPQIYVMKFEIHVLAIVSELYFQKFDVQRLWLESHEKLDAKIGLLKSYEVEQDEDGVPDELRMNIFDFGLRRRWSGTWQEHFIRTMKRELPNMFAGTSNVYAAMKYNLAPIGTMAHEWLQSYQQAPCSLRDFQRTALQVWLQEYDGRYATALTDVLNIKAFLADFDTGFANTYQGVRHDSGCPYDWGHRMIAHYDNLKIDPLTKRLVFSDSLDTQKAIDLHKHFRLKAKTGFGIGTHFTNDTKSVKPLNLVMKLMQLNGGPVAKISDAPGKTLCKEQWFVDQLKETFEI